MGRSITSANRKLTSVTVQNSSNRRPFQQYHRQPRDQPRALRAI